MPNHANKAAHYKQPIKALLSTVFFLTMTSVASASHHTPEVAVTHDDNHCAMMFKLSLTTQNTKVRANVL
ncbi:hypothetical protein [Psychrobacter sp. WY6]|uniref:hypothetical protein n=1 Tax=Psychrobacter sp. WY6 TaxID=2708350 RepID=UPI002022BAE8|nr:hypothetical protein [Psychrobacter sp. WY6]